MNDPCMEDSSGVGSPVHRLAIRLECRPGIRVHLVPGGSRSGDSPIAQGPGPGADAREPIAGFGFFPTVSRVWRKEKRGMVWVALLGGLAGILVAFSATRRKGNFRRKLLEDLEHHRSQGTLESFVTGILRDRNSWLKPLCWVRKPFSREVNLAVETAALLLGIMALVTSMTTFDKAFKTPVEGMSVIFVLGMVLTYIPGEWFFSRRIDAEIATVWKEMEEARNGKRLDEFPEKMASR